MTPLLLLGLLAASLAGMGTAYGESTEVTTPMDTLTEEGYSDHTEADWTKSPDASTENIDDTEAGSPDYDENSGTHSSSEGSEDDTGDQDIPMDAEYNEDESAVPIHIIIVPVALLLIVAAVIVGVVLSQRQKKKTITSADVKEEEALAGCDAEKMPTPRFDDDLPSVLELEIEDVEKWAVQTDIAGETASASGNES